MVEKIEINNPGNSTGKYLDTDMGIDSDNAIRRYLMEGMQDVNLPEARKLILQQEVYTETTRCRDGIVRRARQQVHDFMETTFEISLTPLVTALGVLVVGVTTLSYGYLVLPSETKLRDPVGYIQQTSVKPDGSAHILFLPVDRRG
ncbi:hypothetical protein [Phosphitispora fastidiosa]|uniref:hypothetical protein n=1 Tax=Phosphitispora fastidiosa TaxID=2837202 RepID=UPI001E51BBBD|nr:hypothetical protein [Phosphitispora fastidiosa]MBU7007967.1 hypothetical protein [Phosphitispora fastidiosa]